MRYLSPALSLYLTRLIPHNPIVFTLSRLSCGNRARVSPAGSPEIPTARTRRSTKASEENPDGVAQSVRQTLLSHAGLELVA